MKAIHYEELPVFNKILLGFILLGISFTVINFFNFRSLWLDEAMLSISIFDRSFSELLRPLEFDQVAPIGFLMVEKMSLSIFGNYDWALRILPLICFLTSIRILYKLSFLLFKNITTSLLACALFSLNVTLLYYSIEVKQYMVDLFVVLLLFYLAFNYLDSPSKNKWIYYSLTGFIAVWFSNIAVIILFSIGLYTLWKLMKNKMKNWLKFSSPLIISAISFFIYFIGFIYEHPAREPMVVYWTEKLAFLYPEILSYNFNYFLYSRTRNLIDTLLSFNESYFISLFFILLGIFASLKKHTKALVFILPLVIHLTLAYFKLYPFALRLSLYLIPLFILFLSLGLIVSYKVMKKYVSFFSVYLILIPLAINLVKIASSLPLEHEEIKKSMAYLNEKITETDVIYIYNPAKYAFTLYRNRYENLKENEYFTIGEGKNTLDDIYKQKTLWLLFTHTGIEPVIAEITENKVRSQFSIKGYKISEKLSFTGSSLYKMEL